MIRSLRRFYEEGDRRMLPPDMADRIQIILFALDEAKMVEDMNHPTLRLHSLKGGRKGYWWSVTVRANWRIIFRFVDGKALDVDFVDYH